MAKNVHERWVNWAFADFRETVQPERGSNVSLLTEQMEKQKRLEEQGYTFLSDGEIVTSYMYVQSPEGAVAFASEPEFAFRIRTGEEGWTPWIKMPKGKVLQLARTMLDDVERG